MKVRLLEHFYFDSRNSVSKSCLNVYERHKFEIYLNLFVRLKSH